MKTVKLALALGAAMSWAVAAEAKPPTAFVQCDGYAKPKPGSNNLVKGSAMTRSWSFSRLAGSFNPRGRQVGAAGVDACKAALADPLAKEAGWVRRVTLNQALALHHLEAKQPAEALVAVDAAIAAAGSNGSDLFFARSAGVSLEILRAVALMRLGRSEEGLASVRWAAETRPWSARVQMLALAMFALDPAVDPLEPALADRLRSLNPSSATLAGDVYLRGGRYADAWKVLKARREADQAIEAAKKGIDKALSGAVIRFSFTEDAVAAFAAARAGEAETARAILDGTVALAKAQAVKLASYRKETSPAELAQHEQSLVGPVEHWRPMVVAATHLSAGDAAAAQATLLAATSWPATPLLADLAADIRAKLPPEARKGLVALEPAELRAKVQGDLQSRLDALAGPALFELLPEPEDEDRLNGFSGQFGLGLKSTGFEDKVLPSGLTMIEFVGSVSSPLAVEEMTLLRAARLALKGGHKGFVIEKRDDFTRQRTMTMNGIPTGPSTHAGYMTRIEVRFVDDLAEARAIDAAALDRALSPLYARPSAS